MKFKSWKVLFLCAAGMAACFAWGLDLKNTPPSTVYILLILFLAMGALIKDIRDDNR